MNYYFFFHVFEIRFFFTIFFCFCTKSIKIFLSRYSRFMQFSTFNARFSLFTNAIVDKIRPHITTQLPFITLIIIFHREKLFFPSPIFLLSFLFLFFFLSLFQTLSLTILFTAVNSKMLCATHLENDNVARKIERICSLYPLCCATRISLLRNMVISIE